MLAFITYDNIYSEFIEYRICYLPLMDMVESPWNTLPQTNIDPGNFSKLEDCLQRKGLFSGSSSRLGEWYLWLLYSVR